MDWTSPLVRILIAVVAGAAVGLEREIAGKPAGFRTNILICMGAALAMVTGVELAQDYSVVQRILPDPIRVAQGVIAGIGFLGAGVIIQQRASVQGLTTAATIWVVAAIGVAIGAGYPELGGAATVLTVATLFGLHRLEERWETPDVSVEYEIVVGAPTGVLDRVRGHVEELGMSLFGVRVRKEDGRTVVSFSARGTTEAHDRLSDLVGELESGD